MGLKKRARALHAPGMSALKDFEDFIRDKIAKERWTHKQISVFLEEIILVREDSACDLWKGSAATRAYTRRHEWTTTSWMRPYLMLQTWYTLCVIVSVGRLLGSLGGCGSSSILGMHTSINNNLYERANFICAQLRVLIPAPPFHPFRWVQFMVEKP